MGFPGMDGRMVAMQARDEEMMCGREVVGGETDAFGADARGWTGVSNGGKKSRATATAMPAAREKAKCR